LGCNGSNNAKRSILPSRMSGEVLITQVLMEPVQLQAQTVSPVWPTPDIP
jgi:hypothetical protein